MYELVIKGGRVIDGTGSPSFFADVAIDGGKIVRVAKNLEGKHVIDAKNLVVAPGFIDAHSHSDKSVLKFPDQKEKAEQGITTSVAGQCGGSIAPTADMSMAEFMKKVASEPVGSNLVTFVGHGNLRNMVMGIEDRDPTPDELLKMKDIVREAMESGAVGMSFGLIYTPSCSSKTEELISLAKVVGEYGGVVEAHMRNESEYLSRSVEEMITVAKEAGVRVILSHLKAAFPENWGKVNNVLSMVDKANDDGYDVYCNAYPYTASHTSITARFLPIGLRAEGREQIVKKLGDASVRRELTEWNIAKYGTGRLDWALVVRCAGNPSYEGKTIAEIADMNGVSDYGTVFDIIADNSYVGMCFFSMCERDVETVLAHPRVMICTDSDVACNDVYFHPRLRGSFPRVLGRYVRERGVTTLHEMIRKMTSMPAAVYGLSGKGLIREGMDADICIFDPEKIIDRSDYINCKTPSDGINYVLVGGEVVVENAVYNGKKRGRVIFSK